VQEVNKTIKICSKDNDLFIISFIRSRRQSNMLTVCIVQAKNGFSIITDLTNESFAVSRGT